MLALRRTLTTSAVQRSSLSVLPSAIDPTSTEFLRRKEDMATLERELATALGVVKQGGGECAIAKVRAAGNGKLLVRERFVPTLRPSRIALIDLDTIPVEFRSSSIPFRRFSNCPPLPVTTCTKARSRLRVSSPVSDESLGESSHHSGAVAARLRKCGVPLFTFFVDRIECMIVANDVGYRKRKMKIC